MSLAIAFAWFVGAAEPVLVDRIVASVDDRVVTRSMIDARVRLGEPSRVAARNALIRDLVVENECDRLRVTVEPEEVDRALQEVLATNQVTLEQLTATLEARGYDLASYRKELRRQLVEMRWVLRHAQQPTTDMTAAERMAWLDPAREKLLEEAVRRAVIVVREGEP